MPELPAGTITLLFTDMEGSTRLLQQLGDRYAGVLAECRQVMRTAFQKWNGCEVDTQGDAFFVAFARASDAVAAAADAQCALASHIWPDGVVVRVRMGLHTGEPQLTAENYVGLDVHHAARIMSAGHGGQALLSQTTRDLVEHNLPEGVSLRDLGEHRLKDLQHPSRLYQLVIADLPTDFPPLKSLDRHPHNLPIQPTPFIGRERAVAAVQQLLAREDVHLLTLTGPGGSGKTRLGLQVAAELSDRFADGVYFVNLAPASDPDQVVLTIAQTLSVDPHGMRPVLEALQAFLEKKELLLVLDNFEQVIAAAPRLSELLALCPRLKLLVTSRQALRLAAEHEFAVPPLSLPDLRHLPDLVTLSQYEAVALFIARAQAARPDFQVTNATAPAVAEICARLDGLPLAIELAAARIKLLSPQALLARLGQRLAVLTGGVRDAPARQHTLRNTIDWSYKLLDADEQRLFRLLSVFVGGCTLEAVEAISRACDAGEFSILDGVASLLDKSLLRQSEPEAEEPRFVMLETIREYAWEALAASHEAEAVRQGHALYYLELAEAEAPGLRGPQIERVLARLSLEHDNLRAVMNWLLERGEREMALRLGGALQLFWGVSCSEREGWRFLERALEGSEEVSAAVRAKALITAGNLARQMGHFERGAAFCEQSLALFREIGDTGGMGEAVFHLGWITYYRGDLAGARSLFEEGIELSRKAGNKVRVAGALQLLGDIALVQGDFVKARVIYEESLAISREVGDSLNIRDVLLSLSAALLQQGDLERSHVLIEECLALNRRMGSRGYEAQLHLVLGEIVCYQGDLKTARQSLEKGYEMMREEGIEAQIPYALSMLAKVSGAEGDLAAARALYEESLIQLKSMNNSNSYMDIAPALEGLAAVVVAQGESARAARLLGRAEALREGYGLTLAPIYRADYDRAVAAARAQLGEQAFAAAWAEGRDMNMDQALAARA